MMAVGTAAPPVELEEVAAEALEELLPVVLVLVDEPVEVVVLLLYLPDVIAVLLPELLPVPNGTEALDVTEAVAVAGPAPTCVRK